MSNWDYTDRARTYDKRADYSPQALLDLLSALRLAAGDYVADIGAGTGKLTRPLLGAGLKVRAVEPNERMRQIGIENTKLWRDIEWFNGIAENTTLKSSTVAASFLVPLLMLLSQCWRLKSQDAYVVRVAVSQLCGTIEISPIVFRRELKNLFGVNCLRSIMGFGDVIQPRPLLILDS